MTSTGRCCALLAEVTVAILSGCACFLAPFGREGLLPKTASGALDIGGDVEHAALFILQRVKRVLVSFFAIVGQLRAAR